MKRRTLLVAVLLGALPGTAGAEEGKRWSVGAGLSLVVLGGERETGGPMPTLGAWYTWHPSESWDVSAGLVGGAFGLSGDAHWIGVLAGPDASVAWRTGIGGLQAQAGLGLDGGHVPVCTDWGWCDIRWWVLTPRASLRVAYDFGTASIEAGLSGRYVDTPPWAGVSWEPHARVVVRR